MWFFSSHLSRFFLDLRTFLHPAPRGPCANAQVQDTRESIPQCEAMAPRVQGLLAHGMRLASGGNSVASARTSLTAGACPSTLLVRARGRPSRLDANAPAAAKDRMADQRRAKAGGWCGAGAAPCEQTDEGGCLIFWQGGEKKTVSLSLSLCCLRDRTWQWEKLAVAPGFGD